MTEHMSNVGVRGSFSLADLGVNVKILAAVAMAGLVAVVVGVTGLVGLGKASDAVQAVYHQNLLSVSTLGDLRATVIQARLDLTLHFVATDAAAKTKFQDALTADFTTGDGLLATYADTGEMNRSVSEAASGTGSIAHSITSVAESSRVTSDGVAQTQQATTELTKMSHELKTLVSTFRY